MGTSTHERAAAQLAYFRPGRLIKQPSPKASNQFDKHLADGSMCCAFSRCVNGSVDPTGDRQQCRSCRSTLLPITPRKAMKVQTLQWPLNTRRRVSRSSLATRRELASRNRALHMATMTRRLIFLKSEGGGDRGPGLS